MTDKTSQQLFDRALNDDAVRAKLNEAAALSEGWEKCEATKESPQRWVDRLGTTHFAPDSYCNDLNAAARLKPGCVEDGDAIVTVTGKHFISIEHNNYWGAEVCDIPIEHEALAIVCVWAVATGVEV